MSRNRFTQLNGYHVMWVMVLFDLPVTTPKARKDYTQFRDHLLDLGFQMAQFSIYVRCVAGREAVEAMIDRIKPALPLEGKVDILQITDKQYGNIVCLRGRRRVDSPKNPDQLVMF